MDYFLESCSPVLQWGSGCILSSAAGGVPVCARDKYMVCRQVVSGAAVAGERIGLQDRWSPISCLFMFVDKVLIVS